MLYQKKAIMQESSVLWEIKIPWHNQDNNWWNETCADVVEVFGLPGDRFTSHPTENNMDFYFKSKKDADLCKILLSERI